MRWLCLLILLLCVPGCEVPQPDVALPVNFNITWQIGIVIALAYLANSKSHLAAVAKLALNLLRSLRIVPPADTSESLTAEEVAKKLAELYIQLNGHPETQAGILKLMQPDPPDTADTTADTTSDTPKTTRAKPK